MSWRFRKTFKVLPGVKLNVTSRGLSTTFGVAPFSINVGPGGTYSNVSIPGTGISDRRRLDQSSVVPRQSPPPDRGVPSEAAPLPGPDIPDTQVTEIRSASTEMLKSQSMADLQRVVEEAYEERTALETEISTASWDVENATVHYKSWEKGFLFKRVFSKSFARRRDAFETARAKLEELQEQLHLTVLATQIEIDRHLAEPFYRMRDDFAKLCESQRIWDTLDRRQVDRIAERSRASEAISRKTVSFALGSCDIIQWEQPAIHLPNQTGGDLYIYPGFALYRAAKKAFALIDSREIKLTYEAVRFIEDGSVPSDSKIVGQAWAKSNKDGSPDRRFRDNYQIPVVLYGSLKFTSPTGLQEEFQISNLEAVERFAKSWNAYQSSFTGRDSDGVQLAPDLPPAPSGDGALDSAAFVRESPIAQKLAFEQGDYWEFLLTEELLRSKLLALRAEYTEFDRTLSSAPKRPVNGPDFIPWLGKKLDEVSPMVQQMSNCFTHDIPKSWGEPGHSGDALQILRTVDSLVGFCKAFQNWEFAVCATDPPVKLRPLRDSLRGITGSVIDDMARATDGLSRAIADLRGGSKEFRVKLELSSPPQLARFLAEMDKINKHPQRFLS